MQVELSRRSRTWSFGRGMTALLAPVLLGCSGTTTPSTPPAQTVLSSPAATAAPTALPTQTRGPTAAPLVEAPAWRPYGDQLIPDIGTEATVERGNVRLTLRIDSNPLFGTRESWIHTTLENRGTTSMHWMTGDCGFQDAVVAVAAAAWDPGEAQTGPAGAFKALALAEVTAPIRFELLDPVIDQEVVCDSRTAWSLGPGEAIEDGTLWTGESLGGFGVGPDTPVLLEVRFATLGWHRDGEPEGSRDGFLVQFVAGLVGGRDPAFLSPGQAIDVALTSEELRSFITAAGAASFAEFILDADTDSAMWKVGAETRDGHRLVVVVDGLLATVVEVIESP